MAYHHGHLREAFIEQARGVVEEEGVSGLSLRACARELDVDPAAAYRHFDGKDGLLLAVTADGFRSLAEQMGEEMERIGREAGRARAYLEGCGRAYISFGLDHEHLYRLMFGAAFAGDDVRAELASRGLAGTSSYDLLRDALELASEAGLLPPTNDRSRFLAWSLVHGAVSLTIDGRGPGDVDAAELARDVIKTLLDGLP
jgi:AcrR family transcriptional regulator